MAKGKAGPRPGPVQSAEERAAAKAAKANEARLAKEAKEQERAEAKAAKEQAAADAASQKEIERAEKQAQREAKKAEKSAGIGHNSSLSDQDIQALTVHHKGRYVEALATKKKYDKDFRDVCKKAVADLGENAVDDIKDMILLETDEGEAQIKAQIDRRMRIARWMALPLGIQADFTWQPDRVPLVDRAKAEGFMAGLSGTVNCTPPYDGEAGQAWIAAWHEAQAKRVRENISPIVKKAGPAQSSFDDALPDAGFEPAVPDHANDPTSPANPANAESVH